MQTRAVLIAAVAQAALAAAVGQLPQRTPAAASAMGSAQGKEPPAGREIDDPPTGARWLLLPAPEHSGGPGRLVLEDQASVSRGAGKPGPIQAQHSPRPVIRAGDRVRVEDHSAVAEVTLEAVALGSAIAGAPLRVRLEVGGRVVRAVAAGAGLARLAPAQERWP
jgi:hypothetical protein